MEMATITVFQVKVGSEEYEYMKWYKFR